MKKINIITIIIFTTVILASGLRLVALDKYPAGLNADEAAIGYNAYSLLQTGKDEYGQSWPLSFKSFGDYKPGLYFYFVLPFVAILGLNEWAVRLPSAFLGIGTVVLIYFLGKEFFQNRIVGIVASFFLAITPWHVHFSRGGWETNAATFFITLGIFLFIKGLEKSRWLPWGIVAFILSMYIYQSPRLIVPILLLALIILYRNQILASLLNLKNKFKIIWISFLLILIVPLALQFIIGGGTARFSGLSSFADPGPVLRVNELRGEHENQNSIIAKIVHNKFTAFGPNFLGHYLDHFRSDFLFIRGDPLIRNKVPETGQFYLVAALFLIIGIIALIKRKLEHGKLLLVWILVAPLASSITYQTPHALRALNMVVPLTLVMGYGGWVMWDKIRMLGTIKFITIITVITIILAFELTHYLESYYIHYPKRYPLSWEYGFKEMVEKLEKYESLYDRVVITDRYDQPYILVLFYKQYNPKIYQPQAVLSPRDKFNFGTVRSFDKYEFRPINPGEISSRKGVLFIGTDQEIPKNANIIDQVNFPNGEPAFIFTEGGK